MHILVSLRVFGTKSCYISPFRYRLGLCIKQFTNNAVTLLPQKSNVLKKKNMTSLARNKCISFDGIVSLRGLILIFQRVCLLYLFTCPGDHLVSVLLDINVPKLFYVSFLKAVTIMGTPK